MTETDAPSRRRRLTRDRVIAAAVDLADEIGTEPLTMRRLAQRLGVQPMSLYHHVENKDDILDAMVDVVFAEMGLPDPTAGWRDAVRTHAQVVRSVLARHPWATPMLDGRTNPGAATLRHHDAMLGVFLDAGVSLPLAGHAVAILDAYVYGFAIQEAALPGTTDEELADLAEDIVLPLSAEDYPHLVAFTAGHVLQPGYAFGDEFAYGLELIVDGLAARVAAEAAAADVQAAGRD